VREQFRAASLSSGPGARSLYYPSRLECSCITGYVPACLSTKVPHPRLALDLLLRKLGCPFLENIRPPLLWLLWAPIRLTTASRVGVGHVRPGMKLLRTDIPRMTPKPAWRVAILQRP
jgi:hypothetical protein